MEYVPHPVGVQHTLPDDVVVYVRLHLVAGRWRVCTLLLCIVAYHRRQLLCMYHTIQCGNRRDACVHSHTCARRSSGSSRIAVWRLPTSTVSPRHPNASSTTPVGTLVSYWSSSSRRRTCLIPIKSCSIPGVLSSGSWPTPMQPRKKVPYICADSSTSLSSRLCGGCICIYIYI